jgi:predicted nucleotidyltransferase
MIQYGQLDRGTGARRQHTLLIYSRTRRRHRIIEFAIFGSALRADFGPDSDIDVLVTFSPGVVY